MFYRLGPSVSAIVGAEPLAFHFKKNKAGMELGASEKAVDGVFSSIERIVGLFLTWSDRHPSLFVLLLVFLAFCVDQARRLFTDTSRMKSEYQSARAKSKKNPPKAAARKTGTR